MIKQLKSEAMQERGKAAERDDLRQGRGVATLEDVARAAGVHYSTVSRALDPNKVWRVNVVTRKHVQAVARRMGYQRDMVASGLKRGRTHTVAVVVADLGNPFIAPVLRGIANRLEQAGFMSMISDTQDDSARLERILNHLLSRRVDAIILTAAHLGDGPVLRRISRQGTPVVLAVRNVPGIRLPACTDDDLLGGTLAARHGRRRGGRSPLHRANAHPRRGGPADAPAARPQAGNADRDLRPQRPDGAGRAGGDARAWSQLSERLLRDRLQRLPAGRSGDATAHHHPATR
ncbi:MAG: LacI family transcriptional regulator [Chloroflexi bacterium]|nr:MAG: LacI family transcriptional regulator [Chloroflexota bacterium]